ncbi:MAG: HAMP domain-containing histidine kinase [Planctomycetes bacterium]|nr:HAMP domain-containing histidine kinase [Planctomycetota bacterium]
MNLSLRKRVLLLLVAINAAVAGVLFGYFTPELAKSYEAGALAMGEDLVYTIRGTIDPKGSVNAARILSWPNWTQFADAILVDANLEETADGWRPRGVALNPLGARHRGVEFEAERVTAALARAAQRGEVVTDVSGGRVVPIQYPGGTWGACWYRVRAGRSTWELLWRYFLPGFLLSTSLISAGTYFVLSRFVIKPVERLAGAARAVAHGDFSVRLADAPAKDEFGELFATFNAMTDRVDGFNKTLAAEVARARAEAEQATSAAMKERRLAAMGELAAGIAHEINNPLGGLQNAVEVLAEERLPPEKRAQYYKLLSGGLERIRLTVGRLLRFTPRAGQETEFPLAEPVQDAIQLVAYRASRAGVVLRLGDAEGVAAPELVVARWSRLPAMKGERHEIAQGVLNLLVNALDALEESRREPKTIDVRLALEGARLRLDVVDNGPGAPADALARASDLFFTTKAPGKGTGLGLAIVHGIAVRHGGELALASPPGEGFRATLYFPTARTQPAAT